MKANAVAKAVSLEMAVRAERHGDVSDAVKAWGGAEARDGEEDGDPRRRQPGSGTRGGRSQAPRQLSDRSPGACHCPRNACSDDRTTGVAGVEFSLGLASVGWNWSCGGAAHVQAFAGEGERSEQNQCCVFHGEWLY